MALFRTGDQAASGGAVPIQYTGGKDRLTGVLKTMLGENFWLNSR